MVKCCIITTVPTTIKAFFGDQLKYLQQNGFEVTVITSSTPGSQDFGKDIPEDITVHVVKMARTIRPLEDIKAFIKIFQLLKRGKFDIVQYATPKAALLGSLAAYFARVPVRLYLMWGLYYVTQVGLKKVLFKAIEKIVCHCSTAVAPDSKGNVQFAVAERLCGVDKISVVGHGSANGVDTENFDPDKFANTGKKIRAEFSIPEDAIVFGCIAPTVGDKGINELIEAFDILSRQMSGAYLLYIGQPTEKDPVKDTTLRTIKNNPKIINLGWQPDLKIYMAAMDIFVLPTYREGFGVVNIEASAMRLPVISTDVPGPQESIIPGQTGILVPPKQVAPLVAAMQSLISQPLYSKRLGEAGRKRVQEYYEQKKLWRAILEHRRQLIAKTREK